MKNFLYNSVISFLILFLVLVVRIKAENKTEQAKAESFLKSVNITLAQKGYERRVAFWAFHTNITDFNSAVRVQGSLAYIKAYAEIQKNASQFDLSKLKEDTARQIKFLRINSTALRNQTELKQAENLRSELRKLYSTAKVGNDSLSPGLIDIMAKSRDYDKLLNAWWGWRNESGRKMRDFYRHFVDLKNKGARENGYTDCGEAWRASYAVDNLGAIVEKLWNEARPLYLELHAYVRYKLKSVYPDKVFEDDYIEAHLLGDMWAQNWVNMFDLVEPYKNKSSLDITSNLKNDQRYNTPLKLTKLAESVFLSLDLIRVPPSLYEKSLLEKPKDREVVCHPAARDFRLYKDVRIKQCVEITHNHLEILHHELGHIQYYLQYWDLPIVYRAGANSGFHEAVGDLMSLSVNTPAHLEKLGLLKEYKSDDETDINALMKVAMRKIAFLPFGYLIDQWRWNVFNGNIKETEYNSKWWELRSKYQGIKPPVPRSEKDFDPGAKFHIPGDVPYIRYFVSYVLQFQFHKAACEEAQFKGPLYKCSIYNSTAAGKKIAAMLRMGRSKPWPYVLEKMTGSKEMSVEPIKEYFQPLQEWLVKERCSKKYKIGWLGQPADGVKNCTTPMTTIKPTINAAPSNLLALLYVIVLIQAITWILLK